MPTYQVISVGFHGGALYDPEGKRRTLTVDKPFKDCPSWLKPIKAESAAQKKKRDAEAKAAAEKVAQDDADIKGASFLGDPDAAAGVETL